MRKDANFAKKKTGIQIELAFFMLQKIYFHKFAVFEAFIALKQYRNLSILIIRTLCLWFKIIDQFTVLAKLSQIPEILL